MPEASERERVLAPGRKSGARLSASRFESGKLAAGAQVYAKQQSTRARERKSERASERERASPAD